LTVVLGSIQAHQTKGKMTKDILKHFIDSNPKELYKIWQLTYKKFYTLDSAEGKQRYKNFKATLKKIKEHNKKNLPYKLGLNQFSDMTNAEFKKKMCTKKVPEDIDAILSNNTKFKPVIEEEIKRNLKHGHKSNDVDHSEWFGEVRDQGSCGSCWAFSAVGSVEGNAALKAGEKLQDFLSPQQMMDCDKEDSGCDGGMFEPSFDYIISNGLTWEDNYPYRARESSCNYDGNPAVEVSSVNYCSNYSGNSNAKCSPSKVQQLLEKGPLSVGIDGGTNEFQSYDGGIFTADCSQDNHAVVAVGYGSADGYDYYLVRNSWGDSWGENGYIRVAMNEDNVHSCFVANEVYLPII